MLMILLALGAALLFGLGLLVGEQGLRHLRPLPGACISVSAATVLFLLLVPLLVDFGEWDGRSAGIFTLTGLLFPGTVTLLTFQANSRIGPNLTGTLGNLAPVFAVALAYLLLGEAISPRRGVALLVIVAGVVLLYRTPRATRLRGFHWAFLLPLGAAFIRGMVQPLAKTGLAGWPNPFAAAAIGYGLSACELLSVGVVSARGWPVGFSRPGWLLFSAVGFCNGLAVVCLYGALALGPVTLVAPLVACYPLATLGFGLWWKGTAGLTGPALLGTGFTVAGVIWLLAG